MEGVGIDELYRTIDPFDVSHMQCISGAALSSLEIRNYSSRALFLLPIASSTLNVKQYGNAGPCFFTRRTR